MAIYNFQQTDSAAVCNAAVACTGRPLTTHGSGASSIGAAVGGSAGSGTVAAALGTADDDAVFLSVALPVPTGATHVHIQDIDCKFNLTTALAATSILTGCTICRMNSSCVSQEMMGETTGLTTSLASTGVKTVTVGIEAQIAVNPGDVLLVLFRGSMPMAATSGLVRRDQIISVDIEVSTLRSRMMTGVGL